MKKYRKIALIGVIILVALSYLILSKNSNEEEQYFDDNSKSIKEEDMLSMMLETAYESGEYKQVTQSSWPSSGYEFNPTLSKCENGSELSWDDDQKLVYFAGNNMDKCYVYFDKVPSLTDWVIAQYNGTQGNNNIYYHNGTITSDDGTILDAQDYSYRYAGASDSVNNYVCFGSDEATCPTENLYRIIGVFGEQVKLIKATAATSSLLGTDGAYSSDTTYSWSSLTSCPSSTTGYVYNNSNGTMFMSNKKDTLASGIFIPGCNVWESSDLNTTNLNTNFITNIGTKWAGMIAESTWKVGGNTRVNIVSVTPSVAYQNEVGSSSSDTTVNAKIGLMYVSDYEFAASPSAWTLVGYDSSDETKDYRAATSINWLYLGSDEWLVSRISASSKFSFSVYSGQVYNYNTTSASAVRPVFYLGSKATYSGGVGSSSEPIRLG